MIIALILAFLVTLTAVDACYTLNVRSDLLGEAVFTQIELDDKEFPNTFSSGRPVFKSVDKSNKVTYLYHRVIDAKSGFARWIINNEYDVSDKALAYISSWAVAPHLIFDLHDNSGSEIWRVPDDGVWTTDPSLTMHCVDEDSTIYFESSYLQPILAGFYMQRKLSDSNPVQAAVYTKIKSNESDKEMYMYKFGNTWMVGETIGVDSGYAFVNDDATQPNEITNHDWRFVSSDTDSNWAIDRSLVIHKDIVFPEYLDDSETSHMFPSVYQALRFAHSIKFIPRGQLYYSMRNTVPIPVIGLGTGGILHEETHDVVRTALEVGYRLLDLGEEYNNEHLIPGIFSSLQALPEAPTRNDVFLQSKVWPTHLGFAPTFQAILSSLSKLKTNYLDSYMLHWPKCEKDVAWMHCEDTVDPSGTWQDSWNALEKAYAEGYINSLGVSNFNIPLLEELSNFATIRPHIVQNFADMSYFDIEVRQWCGDRGIIYQPYASGRNILNLSSDRLAAVNSVANRYDKSAYALQLRFFVQNGAVVIPRSRNIEHLKDNLEVFNWSLARDDMESLGWMHTDEL